MRRLGVLLFLTLGCDDGGADTFLTTLTLRDAGGAPKTSFAAGQPVVFELAVTNLTSSPQTLTFPSTQLEDFYVLVPGSKTLVWNWSNGSGFPQVITTLTFAPNETRVFSQSWTQVNNVGAAVPAGAYDAQGCAMTGAEPQKHLLDYRPSEFRTPRLRFTIQ